MEINTSPTFYVVVPGIHSNGREIPVYKVEDPKTHEVIRQIPSEEDIMRKERLANSMKKMFPVDA
ncbi:MAG: flagellar protein FlaG [bacterium]|nr:flagellar protein FlaG [bacterium]